VRESQTSIPGNQQKFPKSSLIPHRENLWVSIPKNVIFLNEILDYSAFLNPFKIFAKQINKIFPNLDSKDIFLVHEKGGFEKLKTTLLMGF
jgi:hypothetical protein